MFQAKFEGRCDHCSSAIEVGDMVEYADDVVVHATLCKDVAEEAPTRFQGTTLDEMGY